MKAFFLLLLLPLPLRADVITLHNGAKMTGVVRETTPETTELQVDHAGSVYFDSATIASVRLDAPQKNKELEMEWKIRGEDAKKKEAEEERFKQMQNEKGLRFYRGEWLPIKDVIKMEQADRDDAYRNQQVNRQERRKGPTYIEAPNSFSLGPAATPTSTFDKKRVKTIRIIHSR